MLFVILLVAIAVAFGLGVYEGPKVKSLYATFSAARALASAKATIAKAEADAQALADAHKLVAANPAPAVAVTGPTGTK